MEDKDGESLATVAKADEAFKDQFQNLSDRDIADLVSRNRKKAYEYLKTRYAVKPKVSG